MLQMNVEAHAEPRGRAGAGAGRGSGPRASLTTVVLSPQGRASCTGRLMVQAVNQRGRSPRPPAGHPHGRRYVLRPSRALLGSRWLLNPAPSAWWGAHREGVLGGHGHVRGSGLPVAGVGTPARRRAQARPVPHRGPPGGPLVSCDHLVPEGLCSRHSAHKFT